MTERLVDQASLRRYVNKRLTILKGKVLRAQKDFETKGLGYGIHTRRQEFRQLLNAYREAVGRFKMTLNSVIRRKRSKEILSNIEEFFALVEPIVDTMTEIADFPCEVPMFGKKPAILGVIPLAERLARYKEEMPNQIKKSISPHTFLMLRQGYEANLNRIDYEYRDIQAAPDLSTQYLQKFNGEQEYYEHLRKTYSFNIKERLKGVDSNQVEDLRKYIAEAITLLEITVNRLKSILTGAESEDSFTLSSSNDDTLDEKADEVIGWLEAWMNQ